MRDAGMLERGLPQPAGANLGSGCLTLTKSHAVSKPLRQMKECSAFKHKYTIYMRFS
jgi:hypothetical protein